MDIDSENQLAPKIKSTACQRCHAKKVRCSGEQPCSNCDKTAQECLYPSRNRRVRVNESYIKQLVAENKRLRTQITSAAIGTGKKDVDDHDEYSPVSNTPPLPPSTPNRPDSSHGLPLNDQQQPWFIDITLHHTPTPINEAADTAFATRIREVLSDPSEPPCMHLPHIDYAGDELINSKSLSETSYPWPKPSRARMVMNVALLHASRCYHIVRRSEVVAALERIIVDPNWRDPVMTCKLRALFALGELCSSRFVPPGQDFPGIGNFAQATKILNYLCERPTLDFIEIRLLLSLYSFTLNRIYASYTLSGSAIRMAVIMGLHLNIPAAQLSDPVLREHRNRVFWTAYMFDRRWATILGCPPAVQDEDVQVDLPSDIPGNADFAFAGFHVAHVKLSSIAMNTVRSVYAPKKNRQASTLFNQVQQRVKELKTWVEELPPCLHLDTAAPDPNPLYHNYDLLSLHLFLNHTIILATRPILLYGLRLSLQVNAASPSSKPIIPSSAKTLIDTCIHVARHSCRILAEAWINGAFPALYHDLTHCLFGALTVVAVSSLLPRDAAVPEETSSSNSVRTTTDKEWFEESLQLLSQLKDSGNFPAREYYRHAELIAAAVKRVEERQNPHRTEMEASVTAGTALAEPSLEELLLQPSETLEMMELPGTPGFDDLFGGENGLYWPEFGFSGV
ncbi:fungal-specific transcription factor domain-containing protein [Podospora australis]|uniref:Fungal-specific transcription factor domain-containing protein n=1 Tax=Podospora australis TaxID=1536484 RepID=A0AAN6WT74_9PEZI|nr:fungal-specific transcription factor domain-containing protein [Podospora australis]